MKEIIVYNDKGEINNTIPLSEEIEFVNNRVWKGKSGIYYKGAGVPYTTYDDGVPFWHASFDKDIPKIYVPGTSDQKGKHDAPYYGWTVRKPEFIGKTGIFLERYAQHFSDCIGSCGPREQPLIKNSTKFEYSGVEYIDRFESAPEPWNNYVYKVNYYNDRVKWEEGLDTKALIEILEYLIKEDWNVPWDIDSLGDVDINGLYTDVADIWKSTSENLIFKFGTVYTFLYGLYNMDIKYNSLLSLELCRKICGRGKHRNFAFNGLEDIPFAIHHILSTWGYEVPLPSGSKQDQYHHMILNVLMEGSTCARCEARALDDDQEEAYSWWHILATEHRQGQYMKQYNLEKDYVLSLRDKV